MQHRFEELNRIKDLIFNEKAKGDKKDKKKIFTLDSRETELKQEIEDLESRIDVLENKNSNL